MKEHFNSLGFFPSTLIRDLAQSLETLSTNNVLQRLWDHDHTLWSDSGDEIDNRMDWLHLYETMPKHLFQIEFLVDQAQKEDIEYVVLFGMGGSSLAPEVFQKIFGTQSGFPKLRILDSTDPGAIQNIQSTINLEKAFFIVATKSGGTVETLSFFKYFYNLLKDHIGVEKAGSHFIAITDPGSKLEQIGKEFRFREIFLNNPNLGGRYSALSFFGLVPAALIGVDISLLLSYAKKAADENRASKRPQNNYAAILGCLLGTAAQKGINKLTFISEESLGSLSDWIEQLIAESTGKSGKGILPVVGEEFAENLDSYGTDRIFILQQLEESERLDRISKKLQAAGYPVVEVQLKNKYQLGKIMLIWEIATAIAGYIMRIHPFNQPNVESAKVFAKQSIQLFEEKGALPDPTISPMTPAFMEKFLSNTKRGDYISIQAFVNPSPKAEAAFRELQSALRDKFKIAVTFGFGPRFLHSTGQLHKGDAGRGIFLQFVSSSNIDLVIPTQAGSPESFISFNILKKAQALGDANALIQANRRLATFNLEEPVDEIIKMFALKIK